MSGRKQPPCCRVRRALSERAEEPGQRVCPPGRVRGAGEHSTGEDGAGGHKRDTACVPRLRGHARCPRPGEDMSEHPDNWASGHLGVRRSQMSRCPGNGGMVGIRAGVAGHGVQVGQRVTSGAAKACLSAGLAGVLEAYISPYIGLVHPARATTGRSRHGFGAPCGEASNRPRLLGEWGWSVGGSWRVRGGARRGAVRGLATGWVWLGWGPHNGAHNARTTGDRSDISGAQSVLS